MGGTKILTLGLGAAQAYALVGEKGTVLIDAGLSGTRLLRALSRERIAITDLSLLLVTHAHADHFGGASALLEVAPKLQTGMGRLDAIALAANAGADVDLSPIGAKGAMAAAIVHVGVLPRGPAFVPGIVFDGGESLAAYGVDAEVLAAPGHTRGSLVVLVPGACDRAGRSLGTAAIVGDPVMGGCVLSGIPSAPFLGEMGTICPSLALLKSKGVTIIHPGHGGPLVAQKVWTRFGV